METKIEKHRRYASAIKQWMHGRRYFNAIRAMNYASDFHKGVRKDGETPEFFHQVSIALYIRTVAEQLDDTETTLIVSFLHDICEDYDVSFEEINSKFGEKAAMNVNLLTKEHRGMRLTTEQYYNSLTECPIASIVKGADRMNNIQTMVGPFSLEKQKDYIKETTDYVLPMLKQARLRFPHQEPVYQNIKHILVSQIELIEAIHEAS